jgi:hypothetical protein
VAYYNAVAKLNKKGKDLTAAETLQPAAMAGLHDEAVTNNDLLEKAATSGGAGFKR